MTKELKKEIESAAGDYANGPDVDEWDNDVCYAAFIAGAEWALKQQIKLGPRTEAEYFNGEVKPVAEEDEEKEVHCTMCGETEQLTYLEQYANGDEYRCNVCRETFII